MILIADSGSTTTFWVLIKETGKISFQTQGLNPYFSSPELIAKVLKDELSNQISCKEVSQIFFYGAGCSTDKNNAIIHDQLQTCFPKAGIEVHHDILGAARALFGREQGIACILGTGCNSCFYDGQNVFANVPSLGYLFGDEGAGSYLGKKLIGKYLKKQLPGDLTFIFDETYAYTLENILTALYKKPFPNRFLASFSLFIKDNIEHPYIHDLVYDSFIDFFEDHITAYDNYLSHQIGFVGSIAFYYRDILKKAMTSKSLTIHRIMLNPLEGLIDYHTK